MATTSYSIVISGWYGSRNWGDEAILASTIGMIRRALPDAKITVFSNSPEETATLYRVGVVKQRGWASWVKRTRALLKADLFVLGGGELLYDSGAGGQASAWLRDVILAKLTGTPSMMLNGGVGLVYNRVSKCYMRQVCQSIELLTVRDAASKSHLRDLGITRPVHIAADSVFSLLRMTPEDDRSGLSEGKRKPTLGVNARPWLYRLEDIPLESRDICGPFGGTSVDYRAFKEAMAAAVDAVKRSKGIRVVFFPISCLKKPPDEFDPDILEEIANLMHDWDDVEIMEWAESIDDMIGAMKQFAVVVGVRLHALVFAALCRVPMLAIAYDPKIPAFMKLIGQEDHVVNAGDIRRELLIEKLNCLWARRNAVAAELEKNVPPLAEKAESSIPLMIQLLTDRKSKTQLVCEGVVLSLKVSKVGPLRYMQSARKIIRGVRQLPLGILAANVLEKIGGRRGKKQTGQNQKSRSG